MRFMSELRKNQSRRKYNDSWRWKCRNYSCSKVIREILNQDNRKDQSRSKYLSETLEGVVVLNDDISDESLLENEGIKDVDFFVVLRMMIK